MRKEKVFVAILAMAVLLMLFGCGRHYVMDRPDMYLVPSLEQSPEKITVVSYVVNPILDLSEGGDGRLAWPAPMWDKDGKETKLLAVNLSRFIGDKRFLTVIPKPLSEVTGSRLAVFDHGGKRIYNHLGEYRVLDSLFRKIKIADYKEFLPEISSDCEFVVELKTDSAEFKAIQQLYLEVGIKEVKIVRDYIYERYGSNLTSEQLDQIAWDDSIIRGFIDWLGRDWKLFIMIPFMDVGTTLLTMGIVKIFTLPSIWGDRIDRPGYMEHKPDAEFIAKMVLRGLQDYRQNYTGEQAVAAIVATVPQADHNLSEKDKADIKGSPCENARTYGEYNRCVLEYNASAKK